MWVRLLVKMDIIFPVKCESCQKKRLNYLNNDFNDGSGSGGGGDDGDDDEHEEEKRGKGVFAPLQLFSLSALPSSSFSFFLRNNHHFHHQQT